MEFYMYFWARHVLWSCVCSLLLQLYYEAGSVCFAVNFPASGNFKPNSDCFCTTVLNQTAALSSMIDTSMKQRWVRWTSCTLHFRKESNFASQLSRLVIDKQYFAFQKKTIEGRLYGGQNAARLCSACEFASCCARHPALCTNRSANMMY